MCVSTSCRPVAAGFVPPIPCVHPCKRPTNSSSQKFTCCAQPQPPSPKLTRRAAILALAGFAVHLPYVNRHPTRAATNPNAQSEAPTVGYMTKSGLKYIDFQVGSGPTPKWGDLINFQYVSYTISSDGTTLLKHDSSYDRGKDGYLIHHGNGEQIMGLEEAIHTMSAGGRRRCIIPPELAYIDVDLGPIPPAAWKRKKFSQALLQGDGTVVFDVEVLEIIPDPDDRGYYSDLTLNDEQVLQIINPEGSEDVEISFPEQEKPTKSTN